MKKVGNDSRLFVIILIYILVILKRKRLSSLYHIGWLVIVEVEVHILRLWIFLVIEHSRSVGSDEYTVKALDFNLTVSSVASELGVTREHLSRVYLQNTGKTPALFIKGKRYERLCDFIASGMPFDKIAERLRFPSVSGMSLFFKKMSGISPSEYRKKGYLKI